MQFDCVERYGYETNYWSIVFTDDPMITLYTVIEVVAEIGKV